MLSSQYTPQATLKPLSGLERSVYDELEEEHVLEEEDIVTVLATSHWRQGNCLVAVTSPLPSLITDSTAIERVIAEAAPGTMLVAVISMSTFCHWRHVN